MRALPIVDKNGYFVEDTLVEKYFTGEFFIEGKGTIISTLIPSNLYYPRWDFDQSTWTEGLSAQDIAALQPVASETPEQKIARLEQSDLDNKELIASLYEMLIAQGGQ